MTPARLAVSGGAVRAFLIAVWLGLVPAWAWAVGEEPGDAGDPAGSPARLQLDALVMSRQSAVCAERMPGYRKRFDTAFDAWKRRNRPQLREGEAALRAESEQANLDHDARMGALADPMAIYLAGADEAQRTRVCEENLQRLQRPAATR